MGPPAADQNSRTLCHYFARRLGLPFIFIMVLYYIERDLSPGVFPQLRGLLQLQNRVIPKTDAFSRPPKGVLTRDDGGAYFSPVVDVTVFYFSQASLGNIQTGPCRTLNASG